MSPRALVVVLEPAWPARAGIGRRVEALVAAVESAAETTVLHAPPRGSAVPVDGPARVLRAERSRSRLQAVAGMARAAVTGAPLTTAYYRRPALRRRLRAVLDDLRPDVVVVHGLGGAALVAGLVPAGQVVLDLADAEHQRLGALGRAMGLRGLPYRLDAERARRWFVRSLGQFGLVTVVSEDDAQAYRSLAPQAHIVVAANGVAAPEGRRPDPGGRRVLFLGDLSYPPNADALRWLAAEVVPLLTEPVDLRVVGRGASPVPGLATAGFVEDLAPEWRAATCMAVPILSGGGTRIKVLDAFAAGIPVVATALGAGGLGAVPGRHFLQADDPASFAQALESLLDDPALRERLAAEAFALVSQQFVWDACLEPIARHVRTLPH